MNFSNTSNIPIFIYSLNPERKDLYFYSHLLAKRIIFLRGELTDEIASEIIAQLLFLAAEDSEQDIFLYINIGKDPSQDDELAMQFLFHDCSNELAEWALSTRILMYAEAAMNETFPLDEFPQVRSSYIVCSEDRTINPNWSRRAFRERFGMEVVELPGGHCPYVSRPAHLASVLNELVTAS